jgi:hypothetical protein
LHKSSSIVSVTASINKNPAFKNFRFLKYAGTNLSKIKLEKSLNAVLSKKNKDSYFPDLEKDFFL